MREEGLGVTCEGGGVRKVQYRLRAGSGSVENISVPDPAN